MRGAGCVVNDLWDSRIDALVERTRSRPLASGRVSKRQAVALFFGASAIGLALLLQFNWFAVKLGFLSVPLFVFYPGTYFPFSHSNNSLTELR